MKKRISQCINVGVPILVTLSILYTIATSNPVEDFVGRWMAFVDPNRSDHLMTRLVLKLDRDLLELLHHGDSEKASAAKVVLAERGNPRLFDTVAKKLKDRSEEVRSIARVLLQALDKDRALKIYIQELATLDKNTYEYRQTLSILAYVKHKPVFPYLIEFARRDVGNKHASSELLREFGDPSAIPVLEEMLTNSPLPDSFEEERIKKAIEALKKP